MIEVAISAILLILLLLLLNPFHFWMPNEAHMLMLIGLVVLFAVFALFVFREKARDEREVLHRFIAGRFAYLVGTALLVIGIVWQSLEHKLDTWLIITLAVMILAKVVGVLYGKIKY